MLRLRTVMLLIGVSAVCSAATESAFAASRVVPLLTGVPQRATATVPEHARSASAIEARFNGAALGAGTISIPLGTARSVVAERLQEFRGARGDVTWSGELQDSPGSMVIITSYRGSVTGFLHVADEIWEIAPGTDGRSMIYRVEETLIPEEAPPQIPDPDTVEYAPADDPVASATVSTSVASVENPVTLDVLVVYTARSVTKAGNATTLQSKIINGVAAANAAYANSRIGINLVLAGMAPTNYAETGTFDTSLSHLRGTSDGYMDEVHGLRDRLGADFVALISDDDVYCGVAYLMGSPSTSFAGAAFSVTKHNCISNQTFAHELGHNQGSNHDRANGSGGAYPYSYGYRTCDNVAPTNGQSFRTVMGYPCSTNVPRLNYFSNPNVLYNGAPMGVAYEKDPNDSADNARSINATAPYVAQFRSSAGVTLPAAPNGLTAQVNAWDQVTLTWNDNAANEGGYLVQRSISGGSWDDRATLPLNSTQYTDTGLTAVTNYGYRVRAFNSAGTSASSNVVNTTTPSQPPPPDKPTPATVEIGTTSTSTRLRWTNVAGESGYEVVRGKYDKATAKWNNTTFKPAANVVSRTETLSAGTYRYKVRATGSGGNSQYVVGQCATCSADGSFTIGK